MNVPLSSRFCKLCGGSLDHALTAWHIHIPEDATEVCKWCREVKYMVERSGWSPASLSSGWVRKISYQHDELRKYRTMILRLADLLSTHRDYRQLASALLELPTRKWPEDFLSGARLALHTTELRSIAAMDRAYPSVLVTDAYQKVEAYPE